MGVVYRAWQPSLGRQVAVKALYRTGDPKAEARFAREIRSLGHVEHPHLVKIFTSGNDGDQWFYAMELVEGAPVSAVCEKLEGRSSHPKTVDWVEAVSTVCAEARKAEKPVSDVSAHRQLLSSHVLPSDETDLPAPLRVGRSYVRQAVELVRQVAEAVHALHERDILHRDIKPGNIMVTSDGSQAVLMDLGLAQIADEVEGRLTKTRQFVGTLRYASPEQVLAVGGLDRRSDIYGLGATLWELITLRPMFNATEQVPTPELMRRIQVEDPEHPRKYHPGLSRDLEAIVLKCLEKDRARRYATARELVRDLERYQKGEPVRARPVGSVQRGWRWCRRNPVVASMLSLLAVVIIGSLAGLTVLYLDSEEQRRIAEEQRRAAEHQKLMAQQQSANADRQKQIAEHRQAGAQAVTRFYEDHVLAATRPKGWSGGSGKGLSLKEALDQAVPKIDEAFVNQPELDAAVRHTLSMTYWYLGDFTAANPLLEKSYALRLTHLGPDNPDTLTSLHDLAMQRWRQGKFKEAAELARDVWARRKRVLGADHEDTLWSQMNLGLFLWEGQNLDEAELTLRQAIDACNRTLGLDHHHTLYARNDLACLLNDQGNHEAAAAIDAETLERRRSSLGPDHPDTLRSMGNLAFSLEALGNLEDAAKLQEEALELRRRVLGDDHIETMLGLSNLAFYLNKLGKLDEAEARYREVLDARRRVLGPEHPHSCPRAAWAIS
jgi:serine/threonine protein kinase